VYSTSLASSVSWSVVVPMRIGGMSEVKRTSRPPSLNVPLTDVSEIPTGPEIWPASTRSRKTE
jgi:hypothetical protein